MKKFILIAIIATVLSSCSTVYFNNVQPSDGTILTEIPEDIHGKWNVENLDLMINSNSVTLIEKKEKLNGKEKDHIDESYFISDSFIVKQAGKYLVFNLKSDSLWSILIVNKTAIDRIEVFRPYVNDKRIKKTNLKIVEAPLNSKNTNEYNVFTSGQITSKQLKKIIDNENRIVFLKNGTSKAITR